MNNIKNDEYYIGKTIENIDIILGYAKGESYESLTSNELKIDGIMFRLIQMVENINKISDEFKIFHGEIEWRKISGFRNGIVHDYGKTDYSIVYEIVTKDIQVLKNELDEALQNNLVKK